MKVVKCINNNVAICLDDDNNELVAFGKGIGFKKPPFEIDVAVIQKTYYGIDENYAHMINEIPEEILLLSEKIIKYAENELDYIFSPNIIFTLADHINFAIVRCKEKLNITLPIVQDIKFLYEKEYAIGKYALSLIEKKINIKLPLEEASFISLHIINAEARKAGEIDGYAENKVIISEITKLIENKFDISINKDGTNYSRFVSHIQYLLKRIGSKEEIKSENKELYMTMKNSYPDTSDCVDSISEYLFELFKWRLSIEEKLYLILHINRLCSREDCYQ